MYHGQVYFYETILEGHGPTVPFWIPFVPFYFRSVGKENWILRYHVELGYIHAAIRKIGIGRIEMNGAWNDKQLITTCELW